MRRRHPCNRNRFSASTCCQRTPPRSPKRSASKLHHVSPRPASGSRTLASFQRLNLNHSATDIIIMSGSIKGSLENVVKGKLVLKGGKGVGGCAASSSSRAKPVGISKDIAEAPKLESAGPKVYDTRTPYEKVRYASSQSVTLHAHHVLPQKVAEARSKRELEQLRSVSSKSHKQRLEVRADFFGTCVMLSLPALKPPPLGIQCQTVLSSRNQRDTKCCWRWIVQRPQ